MKPKKKTPKKESAVSAVPAVSLPRQLEFDTLLSTMSEGVKAQTKTTRCEAPVSEVLEVRFARQGNRVRLTLHLHNDVRIAFLVKAKDAVIDLQGAARLGLELIEQKLAEPPDARGGRP